MSEINPYICTSCYTYKTPIGEIAIASDCYDGEAIVAVRFGAAEPGSLFAPTALTDRAALQLEEYFEGKRRVFELPLRPRGTAFQLAVWAALLDIPYGETRSYKQIAQAVGNPRACRAVGMANNKNPISVIIPCHRVIGADGSLVGYGSGLELKQRLLKLESLQSGGDGEIRTLETL